MKLFRGKKREDLEAWDWKDYRQKHGKLCREIWKRFVPPAGRADTVQGELLREIERLRHEACGNGNINWDEDFAWFCENIRDILLDAGICSPQERERVVEALRLIRESGEYARAWQDGEIPDDCWEPERMACLEEGVYSFLCDMAARFYMENKEPLAYQGGRGTVR